MEWVEFGKDCDSENVYKRLPKEEKTEVEKFREYILISSGQQRTKGYVREVLRYKKITGKEEDTLEGLRHFLKLLKESNFADFTKNKIKGFIYRFLKWKYKDWSSRFENFDDIKYNTDATRKKPITENEVLDKGQIKKLMDAENSLFWKTFLCVSYEGALRTHEARELMWDNVAFEDDCVFIKVSSAKNRNAKSKERELPLKESSFFLKKLKEHQKEVGVNSPYVFPSVIDPNKPVSKNVNLWFRNLTTKVLGIPKNNYILRHSRGTLLKKKVLKNGMSKDNAVTFMGHSEKMFDKVYSHVDRNSIKYLMKKQIFKEDIPPERKIEMEKEIETLKKNIQTISDNHESQINSLMKGMDFLLDKVEFKNGKKIKNKNEAKESLFEFVRQK